MTRSIIREQLIKSKEKKEIIGIWKYNDSDGFWSGYILDVSDELYKMQHFTKYGKSDGIIIEPLSGIESVDFDDDYSRAMHYLIENNELLDIDKENPVESNFQENWQYSILKQVEGNYDLIVRIEINGDNQYSGFVEQVSEQDYVMNCVGKLGEDEGKVIYRLEDVTSVRMNDIDNRKRLLLYNWRKQSK